MRVIADPDLCVGAGQCVLSDPAVFDQDDDGTVAVLIDHPEGEQLRGARTAVALCPGRALSLVEEPETDAAETRRGGEQPPVGGRAGRTESEEDTDA